ncbi:hypothetical protein FRC11_002980 [Ceratobasidium sp. 423]|nr:hypothetical protein FRC11_002980 [Ceratobasidium sp. 423]
MPLYATTSELRNDIWGKRPSRVPTIPESVPEPMSPTTEGPEPPPPTLRASPPLPPTRPLVPQAHTGKDHAETEMRDLSQRVKHSSLPNKDPLVEKLGFVASSAKDAGRNFQKLSSRARGILEQIVSINRQILREVESIENEPAKILDDSPNRLAPALFKSGTYDLLQEVNAGVFDLNTLQVQLNVADGIALQLGEDYMRQQVKNKPLAYLPHVWTENKTLKDFDYNRKLLEEIRVGLERALGQAEGELSLLYQISNDLHVIHDQLSAATLKTDGL